MKAKGNAMKSKTDARSFGLRLWAAVVAGKGDKVYTHAAKNKIFTFKLLPRKDQAPHGKPRGLVSIRQTLQERVAPLSKLVFDKWASTVPAVKELGFASAPPINHGQMFRDRGTGFHGNDIESEFNRLKSWLRQRYGSLRLGGAAGEDDKDMDLEDGDLCEYMWHRPVCILRWAEILPKECPSFGNCGKNQNRRPPQPSSTRASGRRCTSETNLFNLR